MAIAGCASRASVESALDSYARDRGLSTRSPLLQLPNLPDTASGAWTDPHGHMLEVQTVFGTRMPRTLHPSESDVRTFSAFIRSNNAVLAWQTFAFLEHFDQRFSERERHDVLKSMPLLRWAAKSYPGPSRTWRVIFRDHLVENTLGFISALLQNGTAAEDVLVLDKGDNTLNRGRIAVTLRELGITVRRLDNAAVNHTADPIESETARKTADFVDSFIADAHGNGQKVVVVDDGGILAMTDDQGDAVLRERPDAAIELTVSGLKRLARSRLTPGMPIANMARSEVKQRIGYNEIADSCMRRLREALRGEKLIGMRVVAVGYGTLGSRLARSLRALGCRVVVVDTDHLQLIAAAEEGFETTPDVAAAISTHPKLLISSTGEPIASASELAELPANAYVTAFATADLASITENENFGPATLLGDGRSFNLYRFEGIPNSGYDLYRAATFIVLRQLTERIDAGLLESIDLEEVNDWIRSSGVYTRYYDEHYSSHPCAL
ncbi:NAD-binding protein [Curtobacterium flaccumfaciens pv. oortii]|nr:NAD-binding protein [Curtobacterium flaccumfaciens pv. oortii]